MDLSVLECWLTRRVRALFEAEISNERSGGVSPATIESAIDSVWQGAGIMDEGWTRDDYVALLQIAVVCPPTIELTDLLAA